jgi:hypothetical protein
MANIWPYIFQLVTATFEFCGRIFGYMAPLTLSLSRFSLDRLHHRVHIFLELKQG